MQESTARSSSVTFRMSSQKPERSRKEPKLSGGGRFTERLIAYRQGLSSRISRTRDEVLS